MRRAVLDTNVLVSGFIRPQGPPGRLLDLLARGGAFDLILSSTLLDELQRAVHYPKVRSRIQLADAELDVRLAMLDILSIPVEPAITVRGVTLDQDDDHIFAAAVEGQAGHVVTGDGEMLELGEYQGIRIVTPREFLDLLSS